MDLSKLPDSEVKAIASGDMSGLSDDTLRYIAQGGTGAYKQTLGKPDASPSETERMKQKFLQEQGGTVERIKQNTKSWVKKAAPTISAFARPILEAGGAVGGGMLATPETLGLGTVPGAALGYAAGKNVADALDEVMGLKDNGTMLQRFATTGGDLATGATLEMGGQVLGKGLAYGLDKFKAAKIPFTPAATQAKAAKAFHETYAPAEADIAAVNAARQNETNQLLKRIKATETPTPAQASGDVKAAFTEQSLAAKDPALAEALKYKDANLNQAAQRNLLGSLGKGQTLPAGQPAQITGERITDSIKTALEPVKQAERELWAKVPEYPMPHDNFLTTGRELMQTPMVKSASSTVDGVLAYAEQVPKTVQGLQSIERTIGSEINKASMAGDNETKRALTILKDSIKADFDAMGTAAQQGDIALYNGQIVMPSKIKAEIDGITQQIQGATQTGATQAEQNKHLFEYLAGKGEVIMQNTAVSDAMYSKSLADRLNYLQTKKGVGLDYQPPTGGANQQLADNLQAGITSRQAILDNLQPADDVAAAYNAAKQFSKEQKFDRFHVGAVDTVRKPGNQADGFRLTPEAVPAKFFTPSGANDLIRAVGKEQAAQQMAPHATDLLTTKSLNPDGTMNIPRAMAWAKQNRSVINNLGLDSHINATIKGQIPQAIRAQLEAKGVDVLGNPVMGAREAAKFVRQYAPAMRQLYGGNSAEMLAMQDYAKMLEILSRNKNVSYSGGSTSIEKLLATAPDGSLARRISKELAAVVTGGGVGLATGGPVGGAVGVGVGAAAKVAAKYQQEMAGKIINEAITNPEAARLLMDMGRGRKIVPARFDRVIQTIMGYSTTPGTNQQADPLGIRQ